MAQMVKNLSALQETWVLSLDWENPLEKGMTTHSSILAWRIPWIEEPGWLQSMGVTKSQTGLKSLSIHPHSVSLGPSSHLLHGSSQPVQ